jgi:hypothetical protein
MQDYRDGFMSVLFLECKGLHEEFPDWPACCSCCHSEEHEKTYKIYVRPIGPDGLNADWYLCVEAIVCCALYHYVRALPYDWWVEKSKQFKVRRDDLRGYIYPSSPEKDTDRVEKKTPASIQGYKKEKAKREIARQRDTEEAGGLRGWLKR